MRAEIARLRAEIVRLKKEIARLRRLLQMAAGLAGGEASKAESAMSGHIPRGQWAYCKGVKELGWAVYNLIRGNL